MFIKVFLLLIVLSSVAYGDEAKLPFKSVFTEIVPTSKRTLKTSFSKEALPYWGLVIGSTGILVHYDEEIFAESQRKGRDWGIGNTDNTKSFVSFQQYELVRLPSDTGSFMYFLGDGWTHVGIAGAFMGTGQINKDNRAFNTGVMLLHGIFVSTIFNQTLKRSFGRESPNVKTAKGGAWKPFPSFDQYNSKTGSYDAMPSGHIMTATLTFTIISERYPEYKPFIYPLAGVWITALGFQMMNNGVHWAGDYPLGIAMGYVIGKMSTQIGKQFEDKDKKRSETSWMFLPTLRGDVSMLSAVRSF